MHAGCEVVSLDYKLMFLKELSLRGHIETGNSNQVINLSIVRHTIYKTQLQPCNIQLEIQKHGVCTFNLHPKDISCRCPVHT